MLSIASSLITNSMKSFVYLFGVGTEVRDVVVDSLGMPIGDFPFGYLGLPLHSKKLIAIDCRSIVDKISCILRTWSVNYWLMMVECNW